MPKSYSLVGDQNLVVIDQTSNFTNWMYEEIKPYLGGNILEIGSGLGTYSKKVIRDFPQSKIWLSDIDKDYLEKLKDQFCRLPHVYTRKIDLNNPHDFENFPKKFNSIFALNVLEHVSDDIAAIKQLSRLLSPNGKLIFLVPAHKILFNCIDEAVGHCRRYDKQEIVEKIAQTDFKIKKLFYFNFFAIFGWFINGNILKKPALNESAMKFFDKLVPTFKIFERNFLRKISGISLIVILEKTKRP